MFISRRGVTALASCRRKLTGRPTLRLEALEDRTLMDAGALDPTFGTGGRVLTDFAGSLNNPALAVARQPDGKLLVLGYAANNTMADVALARYNADGSLDTNFGTGGRARTDFGLPFSSRLPVGVQLQADGKIAVATVVASSVPSAKFSLALARFTATGTFDTTFGTGGKVLRDYPTPFGPLTLTFQADGKLLAAGGVNVHGPTVFRFNADGALDSGFGSNGEVSTPLGGEREELPAMRILTQADNKILLVSNRSHPTRSHVLIRYASNGSLDGSFGVGGIASFNAGAGLNTEELGASLQPDGRILVAGSLNDDFAVFRYTGAGTVDSSFGSNGRVTTDFGGRDTARAVTVQQDGKIVAAGWKSTDQFPLVVVDFALARYAVNGTLDGGFGTEGKVVTDFGNAQDVANAVLVDPDGKVVAAGATLSGGVTDFALVRCETSGGLDGTFGTGGKVTTDFVGSFNNFARAVAPQADGKLLVVGNSHGPFRSEFSMARYLDTGALDTTFGSGGRVLTADLSTGTSITLLPDGLFLVGGRFNNFLAVARFHADGRLDTSFGAGGRALVTLREEAFVEHVLVQPDGKLLVVGSCPGFVMSRLHANGGLDESFGAGGRVGVCAPTFDGWFTRTSVQADGKVVVLTTTLTSASLSRYNTDGSVDASFRAGLVGPGNIYTAPHILPDGKLLLAWAGLFRRYLADGSPDTSFGSGGSHSFLTPGIPSGIVAQPDGMIVVSGVETLAEGNSRLFVARFHPTGQANFSFGTSSILSTGLRFTSVAASALQPDSKLVVIGSATGADHTEDFAVARLLLTDTLTTANNASSANSTATCWSGPPTPPGSAPSSACSTRGP